jgi:BASS family bile acid:Na+ symporter
MPIFSKLPAPKITIMNQGSTVVLIAALFIIMFGMGLTLTKNDFHRVIQYPKAVVGGLINQVVLLPLVGYALVVGFNADTNLAVGLMILAACPGGATSNLITHLAKGDTALSVTLTAISSLITIITIPLITAFALNHFAGVDQEVEINVPRIFGQLLIIIVIPISLGMWVKARRESFADRMERPVKIASALVLALVILGIILKEKENIINYFEQAGLMALALNLSTMLLGFLTAKLLRLSVAQTLTLSIETGIQNGTMAIGVATIALNSSAMAIPAAIYSLIMFGTGFALIVIGSQSSTKAKAESLH